MRDKYDNFILWVCCVLCAIGTLVMVYQMTVEHIMDDCYYQGYFEYKGQYFYCLHEHDEPK